MGSARFTLFYLSCGSEAVLELPAILKGKLLEVYKRGEQALPTSRACFICVMQVGLFTQPWT